LDTLRPAVIADPVDDGRIVDDGARVYGGNVGVTGVVYSAVVVEFVAPPVPALIAPSDIAESIVDAAVESNIPAPVAVIKAVPSSFETPISWRPKSSPIWGLGPSSGYPVVARRSIAPVSRSPEITRIWNRRLFIFRQRRRRLRGVFGRGGIVGGFAVILIRR
jgi:hypothetical protein